MDRNQKQQTDRKSPEQLAEQELLIQKDLTMLEVREYRMEYLQQLIEERQRQTDLQRGRQTDLLETECRWLVVPTDCFAAAVQARFRNRG